MASLKINTHNTETFKTRYIQPGKQASTLLKPHFDQFFIVKVEDLIRLIKLPVPPSRATTHTFIYLTEGEATMTIGSQFYKILKNECLVVPAGQVYSFAKHDVNKGYLCNFHSEMLTGNAGRNEPLKSFEFLNVWGNPHIKLHQSTAAPVLQLLKRMYALYSKNGLTHSDLIAAYLTTLFCEINIVYQPQQAGKQNAASKLTNAFRQLIFKHIKTKHLVTEYAELLHVSPNHLNKTIKTVTGKSPTKWIDDAIILEAKVLLYQTNASISEIAAETGFLDASYFTRLFKKYEGITPMQFRQMIEKS